MQSLFSMRGIELNTYENNHNTLIYEENEVNITLYKSDIWNI